MPDEIDEFLEGVKGEQNEKDPFKTDDNDPFAPDSAQEEVKEEKEEKSIPFHKDPKLQKFIEKEVSKRISEIKPTETEKFVKESNATVDEVDEATAVLTRLIGNDTPERVQTIKDMKRVFYDKAKSEGAKEALHLIEEQAKEQQREQQKEYENSLTEVQEGFDEIKDTFGIDLLTRDNLRTEFVEFVEKVANKRDGEVVAYPDFVETFRIFKDTKKANPSADRAKELASRGLTRSGNTSSFEKAKGHSWKDIDKIFSKFSN